MKTLIAALTAMLLLTSCAFADICTNASDITIAWPASPEPDVAEYVLYSAPTVDGEYVEMARIIATTYDATLPEGLYFFKLRAVDKCGNESDLSLPSEGVHIDRTSPSAPTTITITVVVE